jgi:hypothetical protein
MGLNSEWNDYYSDGEESLDSVDGVSVENLTYEDWCGLYIDDLLNDWFTLQEQAQMYSVLNTKVTFSDFCQFMYQDDPTHEDPTHEDPTQLSRQLDLLWKSIGSPKTFYEFYMFYK